MSGSDTLDGGGGIDTAIYSGFSYEYVIEGDADYATVTHIATGDTDILTSIETLQFEDASLSFLAPTYPDIIANVDTFTLNEDHSLELSVLANDVGEGIYVVSVTSGLLGTAELRADGTIVYTPTLNAFGVDTITYTIRDALGQETTATATIEILSINDAPAAQDDFSKSEIPYFRANTMFSTMTPIQRMILSQSLALALAQG